VADDYALSGSLSFSYFLMRVRDRAILFLCRPDGLVLKVFLDQLGLAPQLAVGAFFSSLIDPDNSRELGDFLQRVQETDSLVQKELNTALPTGPTSLFFYGQKTISELAIFGSPRSWAQEEIQRKLTNLTAQNRHVSSHRFQKTCPAIAHEEGAIPAKAKLLALATHDLRNPIAGILAASQYLIDETTGLLNEEHSQLLGSIETSCRFLLRLVDDVMEISSIESGIIELELQPTDLVEVISQNLVMNRLLARNRGIQVRVIEEGFVPAVNADPSRMHEVVDNLVTNAIKFSRSGGTVEIRVGTRGDMTMMSFRDEGEGIPPGEFETIFKPFQKRRIGRGIAKLGTGLGLAIARHIVENHGGRIELKSQVGHGSMFTVLLPVAGKPMTSQELEQRVEGQGSSA
jgi:signal transduction histidine kinase